MIFNKKTNCPAPLFKSSLFTGAGKYLLPAGNSAATFFRAVALPALLYGSCLTVEAAVDAYFKDCSLPRPAGMRTITADEFKVDLQRIDARKQGHLYGDKAALRRLGEYFLNDPRGIAEWKQLSKECAGMLKNWDFNRNLYGGDQYITVFYRRVEAPAMIYMFTGHPELGRFLHDHIMQVAALPDTFWLDSNPHNPTKVGLTTASAAAALASALSFTEGLLTQKELEQCKTALRLPYTEMVDWLKKPWMNNWTAVISSSTYVCARYFQDAPAAEKALKTMKFFLDATIEDDGSYGEGTGYFAYPVSSMLNGILCISTSADRQRLFSGTSLKNSARWMAYPYLYIREDNGENSPTVLHFGDNSYFFPPSYPVNMLIATAYRDGLAHWLLQKFGTLKRGDWMLELLSYRNGNSLPPPRSPAEEKLPLLKCFDNGDCYIRSSWQDNAIVAAMHVFSGCKTTQGHRRPEINSVVLGAYGEYLVVSPGSASYTSPVYYSWDMTTRSTNTITINDKNQLFPGDGKSRGPVPVDTSAWWLRGIPKAQVISTTSGKIADVIVSEARDAYLPAMDKVRRGLIFVREPGYFIIVDRLEAKEGRHNYCWRMHFNNRDGKAALQSQHDNTWLLTRPRASLLVYFTAAVPTTAKTEKGYMHGIMRGGAHEGKPGSSIELALRNTTDEKAVTYLSVLYPLRSGQAAPPVSGNRNELRIGTDRISLRNGTLNITGEAGNESFVLWKDRENASRAKSELHKGK